MTDAILDAHVHLWDHGQFGVKWAENHPALPRGYEAYRIACAGSGIAESIAVEVDVVPADRLSEAADFAERHRRGEIIGSVACFDPRDATFATDVQRIAALPGIRGVRWIARREADAQSLYTSPLARLHLELLGRLGLAFDLNVPPAQLLAGAAFVAAVPGTRIVLDHCGNADSAAFGCDQGRPPRHDPVTWRRGIDALGALPHVACKVSGIVTPLAPGSWSAGDLAPVVEHCRTAFGERLIFGTDWPVCTFGGTAKEWIAAAKELASGWTDSERAAFFGGTARRWYAL